ncbi:MAG: signal peptidase I, partial [Leptolyngbya sp. SIO1D8]|nr:signal peptidase I [Leptolyngbya sp. SIO1D8]
MASSFPVIRPKRPDPWLAVNYSLVFPGLGQLYSRHGIKGSVMVVAAGALLSYAVWSIFGVQGNTIHGFWAIACFIVLYSFGILDAYRGTQPGYATRISVPQSKKDVWYAVFLCQILPGLGHLYLQQAVIGVLLLIVGITTAWLANSFPALVPIPPLIWAFSCCHVYTTYPHRASRRWGAIALLVLGLFLVRFSLGAAPGWIQQTVEQCIVPTESMVPTLQVGDRLFVWRNQPYQPKTGDIVVFEPPKAALERIENLEDFTDLLYVKRIIGLPGQTVEVSDGQVYIGDRPLEEPYLQAAPSYEWGPETVPEDRYFVLGDNRNDSSDSHIWGYVSNAN